MEQEHFESNQNQNQIEADINRVGKEVGEQLREGVTVPGTERALVHQSLHPLVQAPAGQTPQAATDDAMLPSYMKDATAEVKERVERLVEDAFKHGVEHAAAEAQKSGPFVVDALHDALSDRFYEELKKRSLI